MPRGGKRDGAGRPPKDPDRDLRKPTGGRPKNSPNKFNAERMERARATGQLPSEIMLELGRFCKTACAYYQPTRNAETGSMTWQADARDVFITLARLAGDLLGKAAPYLEQKQATVHELRRIDLTRLDDAELDVFEEILAKATDEIGNPGRTTETIN